MKGGRRKECAYRMDQSGEAGGQKKGMEGARGEDKACREKKVLSE